MTNSVVQWMLALLFLAASVGIGRAQCEFEDLFVQGPGAPNLGSGVAVRGNLAVAAAEGSVTGAPGYAEVFRYSPSTGWVSTQTLTHSFAQGFGKSLDTDGRRIAVSAIGVTSGDVVVYRSQGGMWELEQIIGVVTFNDSNVAILGQWLAVSTSDNGYGPLPSVRVYRFSNGLWGGTFGQFQELFGPAGGGFGQGMALARNTLFVGSPDSNAGRGSVEIYQPVGGSWQLTTSLVAPPSITSAFGTDVAYDDQRLIASAGSPQALVYYELSQGAWVEMQVIQLASSIDTRQVSVDFNGSVAVAGITSPPFTSPLAPQVFELAFLSGSWGVTNELCSSSGQTSLGFGREVAVGAGHAIIGDPLYMAGGAVTFFTVGNR